MSIALHYSFRKIDHIIIPLDEEIIENLVEQVYLKQCELFCFPKWLERLTNLTHINISHNSISKIPPEISILQNLAFLDVSNNCVTTIPTELFELKNLTYLDLGGNFIDEIPREIENLASLEGFLFDRNSIKTIPIEMTRLIKIFHLSFENCSQLTELPRNILMMPNLLHISFKGCNLSTIPSSIANNLENMIICDNKLLNCIPYEASRFLLPELNDTEFFIVPFEKLDEFRQKQNESIISNRNIKFFILKSGAIVNVPRELDRILFLTSSDNCSLRELSLRAASVQQVIDFNNLPTLLINRLKCPTSICSCNTNIFNEAFGIYFYEKCRPNLQITFSKYFCSKSCLLSFYNLNSNTLVFIN